MRAQAKPRQRECWATGCHEILRDIEQQFCVAHWSILPWEIQVVLWRGFKPGCTWDEHALVWQQTLFKAIGIIEKREGRSI